ncbi:hypothetical protein POL68_38325 [Stigmatella sp. ncwal1]|uniref:Uncharacterized protein n=1 Tax=Stigmatella ashevillensis TaxID=2995309 RepID=A0ABT5DL35_9BACT|nr:hypothetical protein [Stigmatella ashevillena]MDC0714375.1 hypothetical protein [Stigmatella ashevillena]
MRTTLYVLGALLCVLPGRMLEGAGLPRAASAENRNAGSAQDNGLRPATPGGLKHPCQLITFIQVPCDAATATCEYMYWECPQSVSLLRA